MAFVDGSAVQHVCDPSLFYDVFVMGPQTNTTRLQQELCRALTNDSSLVRRLINMFNLSSTITEVSKYREKIKGLFNFLWAFIFRSIYGKWKTVV